ncbi:MAG: hypothetical protein N2515_00825 [Deltaproteobacteria bacterium]|nr:hypothetical protein [Deltaproteobacteria bacterium]
MPRREGVWLFSLWLFSLCCVAWGCGTPYVQPPPPPEEKEPVLSIRPFVTEVGGTRIAVDSEGELKVDGEITGFFFEDGRFHRPNGQLFARIDREGRIQLVDREFAEWPPHYISAHRLIRSGDGALLAWIDESSQLHLPSRAYAVQGITSRNAKLLLFAFFIVGVLGQKRL